MMKKIKTTINHHKKRFKKLLAEGIITSMVALSTLSPFANLKAKDIDYDKLPTIKKETLLNYQEQLLNNKIDGIKYYSPKEMKEVKAYYLLETTGTTYFMLPAGNKLNGLIPDKKNKIEVLRESRYSMTYLEENYDVYNKAMKYIRDKILTQFFPMCYKNDNKVISNRAFITKEWYVIPTKMKYMGKEFYVLQIINKNQLKKLVYSTVDLMGKYIIVQKNKDKDDKEIYKLIKSSFLKGQDDFKKMVASGTLFNDLDAMQIFPHIPSYLGDYPYFHYKTQNGKRYNFAAYLPLFPKDVKESYRKDAEKITDGDFLEKLIKQGKIDKQNPWYDAIQKGYVRIVEARDPVHKDKNVLAVVTPAYTAFFVDTEKEGVIEAAFQYPKNLDKIDGIFCGYDGNSEVKVVIVGVWNNEKRIVGGAGFGYYLKTNRFRTGSILLAIR